MGTSDTKEIIVNYYLFQRKIKKNLLNENKIDDDSSHVGYIIHPEWITEWKNIIGYESIKNYLDRKTKEYTGINKGKDFYKEKVNKFLKNNKLYIEIDTKFLVKNHGFVIEKENIYSEKFLENFVDEDTFDDLKINKKTKFEKLKYIFKSQMILFFFKRNLTIKVLIHSMGIINLRMVFYDESIYENYKEDLKKQNSVEMINYFSNKNVFIKPIQNFSNKDNKILFTLINEEGNQIEYSSEIDRFKKVMGDKNDINNEILHPKIVNFNLLQNISYRGLDNVGATCYMNATLQNLANIKPITEYLLNYENYKFLCQNVNLCLLTLKYTQVLIGLFCNESSTGSYCPEDFKKIISDFNPLFQGVQANDSKDLIIFLLEVFNSELVKIYRKKHNITIENDKSLYKKIDIFNEGEVFEQFKKNFNENYCSVIGKNLCGFQKSIFICQNCGAKVINFNIFNFLIFSLEATSNQFNLSHNNSVIPVINFDHCFQFLSKNEEFQDTYCQKCKKNAKSKYREIIYTMPNYLIIILNRGKGNIFNCKVDIPKEFTTSTDYVEKEVYTFRLIGIVSHFGESGMGGHFIAFCRHNKDRKWRCYNDSVVTECKDDYLQKGTPYILFYEKKSKKNVKNSTSINMNNRLLNDFKNDNFQQNNNNKLDLFKSVNINMIPNSNNGINNLNGMNIKTNIPQNMNIKNNLSQNMNFNNNFCQMNSNNFNSPNMNFNSNSQNMNINNNFSQNMNFNNNSQNMNFNNNSQNMNFNNNSQNMIFNKNSQNMNFNNFSPNMNFNNNFTPNINFNNNFSPNMNFNNNFSPNMNFNNNSQNMNFNNNSQNMNFNNNSQNMNFNNNFSPNINFNNNFLQMMNMNTFQQNMNGNNINN